MDCNYYHPKPPIQLDPNYDGGIRGIVGAALVVGLYDLAGLPVPADVRELSGRRLIDDQV